MENVANQVTRDLITGQIRRLIVKGGLKDGEEVTQNELAESLGVSRMPVREAMQELVQQGLFEKLANRHIRVNGLTKARAASIVDALSALEKAFLAGASAVGGEGEYDLHKAFFARLDNPMLSASISPLLDGCIAILIEERESPERTALLRKAYSGESEDKLDQYFSALKKTILEDIDADS